jgi:hypothetical protein
MNTDKLSSVLVLGSGVGEGVGINLSAALHPRRQRTKRHAKGLMNISALNFIGFVSSYLIFAQKGLHFTGKKWQ